MGVGLYEGSGVGADDGTSEGADDGTYVGACDGAYVGTCDGGGVSQCAAWHACDFEEDVTAEARANSFVSRMFRPGAGVDFDFDDNRATNDVQGPTKAQQR